MASVGHASYLHLWSSSLPLSPVAPHADRRLLEDEEAGWGSTGTTRADFGRVEIGCGTLGDGTAFLSWASALQSDALDARRLV